MTPGGGEAFSELIQALRSPVEGDASRAWRETNFPRPVSVAFTGETSAGKSALINAVCGGPVTLEKLSPDTTDKIYEVRLPNGNTIYDTPGSGGHSGYEGVARAFLGLGSRDVFDVPICGATLDSVGTQRGALCPFRVEIGGECFVPKASRDEAFYEALREHHEMPEDQPWAPTLCGEDHRCPRLVVRSSHELPNVDAVVVVLSPTLRGPARRFSAELAASVNTKALLWAVNHRGDVAAEEAVAAVAAHVPRQVGELVAVNAKEKASVHAFLRRLVRLFPEEVVDAFDGELRDSARHRRREVLTGRIAEAAIGVALFGGLWSLEPAFAVLDQLMAAVGAHYGVEEQAWRDDLTLGNLGNAAIRSMQLPGVVVGPLEAHLRDLRVEVAALEATLAKRAREAVLRNPASRILNRKFRAWKGAVERKEEELREQLGQQRYQLLEVEVKIERARSSVAPPVAVAEALFVQLLTFLGWLEHREHHGRRPLHGELTTYSDTAKACMEQRHVPLKDTLEVGDRPSAVLKLKEVGGAFWDVSGWE